MATSEQETKQYLLPIIVDSTAISLPITRNLAWHLLVMKSLDKQKAMDKETAIILLQQHIRACRLCQEHGNPLILRRYKPLRKS